MPMALIQDLILLLLKMFPPLLRFPAPHVFLSRMYQPPTVPLQSEPPLLFTDQASRQWQLENRIIKQGDTVRHLVPLWKINSLRHSQLNLLLPPLLLRNFV